MAKSINIIWNILFIAFLFSSPVRCADSRQTVKDKYISFLGVREATGHNDGKDVELFLKTVHSQKGSAWCAAFVCYVLHSCEVENPMSAWSPALFTRNVIYKRGGLNNKTPCSGDVFGLYFTNLKRVAHVGFVDKWTNQFVITVEGNTNEAGSREGDGVYRKRRPIRTIYIVSDYITH
jgi:hypothetical protein